MVWTFDHLLSIYHFWPPHLLLLALHEAPHNSLVLLLTNFFYCLPPKLPPSSNQDAGSRNFHLWIQTKTLPPPSSKAEPSVVVFKVFKDWWVLGTFDIFWAFSPIDLWLGIACLPVGEPPSPQSWFGIKQRSAKPHICDHHFHHHYHQYTLQKNLWDDQIIKIRSHWFLRRWPGLKNH